MKVVIPARYASSRLPGKPLLDIASKPMIEHVWRQACIAADIEDEVIIAADDDRILEVARAFGAQIVETCVGHESGMDRIAEVVRLRSWPDDEIIVNLQGDEPLMPPPLIRLAGEALLRQPEAALATASCKIHSNEDLANPNIVKVVTDHSGMALYFSRSPIPYNRAGGVDVTCFNYQRHIGLYAYRAGTLCTLAALPVTQAEYCEQLEQLRALDAGMKIYVEEIAEAPPHGVDTPADLAAVRQTIEGAT